MVADAAGARAGYETCARWRTRLIPGGGQAWYWHRLAPELRSRGHDAIAVDLPADDDAAGIEEYAAVVLEAIGDRDDLVVVAQSMGGLTGPLVCERVAVTLLVLLNAMILRPGEVPGAWWADTGHAEARAVQAARDGRSLETIPTCSTRSSTTSRRT